MSVNGQSMAEYTDAFTPWIRHSSLPMLYWIMAYDLPKRVSNVPAGPVCRAPEPHPRAAVRSALQRFAALPRRLRLLHSDFFGTPGFVEVMRRENFHVLLDRNREIISAPVAGL